MYLSDIIYIYIHKENKTYMSTHTAHYTIRNNHLATDEGTLCEESFYVYRNTHFVGIVGNNSGPD